jgi:hypothetical protein
MKRLMWVLWPSFLVAIAMDGVLFSTLDPLEISYGGEALFDNRMAAYTISFFVFWLFAAGSSALTCYLQSTMRGTACPPNGSAPSTSD